MAGNSNIFNADPLDVFFEALVYGHGLQLRRDEVELQILSQTSQDTLVRIQPRLSGGTTIYVDTQVHTFRKLNLNGKMPKDMSYSGYFPLTQASLHAFFSSSYGLAIRSGEWKLQRSGVTQLVDGSLNSNGDYASAREFALIPSGQHPLFQEDSFELPVYITEPLVSAE